jgi:hypothetical protein
MITKIDEEGRNEEDQEEEGGNWMLTKSLNV